MGIFIDLTGQKFGRLTVIKKIPSSTKETRWKCICDCGTIHETNTHELRRGSTKSCGCLNRDQAKENIKKTITHGMTNHRFYGTWYQMNNRCYNPNNQRFKSYGKRGISVCDEWKDDPTAFLSWCDSQEPIPDRYTIDRINNDGNYCPENCRFVSYAEQMRGTSRNVLVDCEGETLCFTDYVKKYNIVSVEIARRRLSRGWDLKEAALTPLMNKYKE